MSKVSFVIQARTNSTRLPNKVVMPFHNELSILDILITAIKREFPNIDIIIATTNTPNDDAIAQLAENYNVFCFRGAEANVLSRFIAAGEKFKIDNIIRICADNPFLNMSYLKKLIENVNLSPKYDYYSFKNGEGTPVIKTHYGLFAEIVKLEALKKVANLTTKKFYLEHVTNYLYLEKGFNIFLEELPEDLKDRNDLRFTIDDVDDFENLSKVYPHYLTLNYNLGLTIAYIDANPDIKKSMIENIKKYSK